MADSFEYDVFISFSVSDEEVVRPLWEELGSSGLRVFWSNSTLKDKLGEKWFDTIQSAIGRSKHFLLIVTHASMSSEWVKREYQAFLNHYYKSGSRLLIPVLVGNYSVSKLPMFLDQLQSCRLDQQDSVKRIIQLLWGTNVEELKKDVLVKEEEIRILRGELESLKSKLRNKKKARQVSSFHNVKDAQALVYLEEMSKLHNEIARKTHFLTSDNMILEYLVKYYMKNHVKALKQVCYVHTLPLPSEPRMEAAIQAISNSREKVIAISILKNDQWHQSGEKSPYIRANIETAKKGIPIQRVFIVENEKDLKKIEPVIKLKRAAGIELQYAVRKNLTRTLNDLIDGTFTLVNILICDRKILTLSTHHSKHDGSLVLNPDEIGQHEDRFKLIWDCSQPI